MLGRFLGPYALQRQGLTVEHFVLLEVGGLLRHKVMEVVLLVLRKKRHHGSWRIFQNWSAHIRKINCWKCWRCKTTLTIWTLREGPRTDLLVLVVVEDALLLVVLELLLQVWEGLKVVVKEDVLQSLE